MVLNAKYHEREAEIVAQAGRFGAVTIATNMAGRGTDIILGGVPDHRVKAVLGEQGGSTPSTRAPRSERAARRRRCRPRWRASSSASCSSASPSAEERARRSPAATSA